MRTLLVATVIVLSACGGGKQTLSESFCNDLRNGISLVALYRGSDDPPEKFADRAYGMAAVSCPEQLKTNQVLRDYLMGWQINPDA